MSKVIQVLETMASDASLVNKESIRTFLTATEINAEQEQAIIAKNVGQLADTIADLPKLVAFSQVIPADDDAPIEDEQEDDNTSSNKLLAASC